MFSVKKSRLRVALFCYAKSEYINCILGALIQDKYRDYII